MLDTAPLRFGFDAIVDAPSLVDRIEAGPMTASQWMHASKAVDLVRALPADGAVVIVHATAAIAPMKALILELRGETVANLTRVLAAPALKDERALTGGLDLPVHRDPFVDEQREHARALKNAWRL